MSRSLLAAVTLFLTPIAAAAADEKARAVIDRAIEAHGGKTNVEKLSTAQVKVEGKATLPGIGSTSTVIQDFWHLPSQYKTIQEYEAMGMKFVQTIVMNGDQMWISVNGQTQSLPKEAQAEMKEEHYAQTIDSHFKFWAASIDFFAEREGGKAYGFRVSSRNLRLLIDAVLPDSPTPRLLYIIQSARPIESKVAQ